MKSNLTFWFSVLFVVYILRVSGLFSGLVHSCIKAPSCCSRRQTVKALLFVPQYLLSLMVVETLLIFCLLLWNWFPVASLKAQPELSLFITLFLWCGTDPNPKLVIGLFACSKNEQETRSLHSHCKFIFGKAPRPLISLHANFVTLHHSLSQKNSRQEFTKTEMLQKVFADMKTIFPQ